MLLPNEVPAALIVVAERLSRPKKLSVREREAMGELLRDAAGRVGDLLEDAKRGEAPVSD